MNTKEKLFICLILLLLFFGTLPFYLADELDNRFSPDSCIVIGSPVSRACQPTAVVTTGFPETLMDDYLRYQFFYRSLEEALALCPFHPVIIELTGYHYIEDPRQLVYNRSSPLVIRGVGSSVAVVANFYGLTIVEEDVSVHFENWVADGCGVTTHGLFFKKHTSTICIDSECKAMRTDMDCHSGGQLTLKKMQVTDYRGPYAICKIRGKLAIASSVFRNIPFTAVETKFTDNYSIVGSSFCPCGHANNRCIGTYRDFVASSSSSFYANKNTHCF